MHQLDDIIKLLDSGEHITNMPPIQSWHPHNRGKIDISIDSQGKWFHEGEVFKRDKLVKLFASILRFEHNAYYLVTPVEQLEIQVADVPFIAELLISSPEECVADESKEGRQVFQLVTQCDDIIILNKNSQWELREYQGELVPYVLVRHELWARLARHVFYQLIDIAATDLPENAYSSEASLMELTFDSAGVTFTLGQY